MQTLDLPIDQLQPHPANSNVMPEQMLDKLAAHIDRSHRYPPLIVRPLAPQGKPGTCPPRYQILDGHHRRVALQRLGHTTAVCSVWEVDDREALVLLATLNRLEGRDDPRRRAELLRGLRTDFQVGELAERLPERVEQIKALLDMTPEPPKPAPPPRLEDMPLAVQFFLVPADRDVLERRLRATRGTREEALMHLINAAAEPEPDDIEPPNPTGVSRHD